jgi:hypothetical protein
MEEYLGGRMSITVKIKYEGKSELPEHDQYLPMWHIDVVFESLIVFGSHPRHEPPFLAVNSKNSNIIHQKLSRLNSEISYFN